MRLVIFLLLLLESTSLLMIDLVLKVELLVILFILVN